MYLAVVLLLDVREECGVAEVGLAARATITSFEGLRLTVSASRFT